MRVDDHVVRLSRTLRQIVLGVNHAGGLARGPSQRLERIAPFGTRAQVDLRQVFRLTPPASLSLLGRHGSSADSRRRQFLNLQRERQLRVGGHPLDHRDKLAGIVPRPHDSFQRMTMRARPQRRLFCGSSGHALNPFRVRQLRRQILCFPHGEIDLCGLVPGHIRRGGTVEVITRRADAKRILAGFKPGARKSILPLLIGDDGDGDRGAGRLRADQHAFQRPVGCGDHPPAQCRLLARLGAK